MVCRGSDPRRAHGLAPALALLDEPAQWPRSTANAMLAALTTADGKIPDAVFLALGTRPAEEDHWFAEWLSGGCDYAQVHTAGDNDPLYQRRTWKKANPALDAMPVLEAAIRKHADRAKKSDRELQSFRALRLNQGTSDVARASLLSADEWKSCERDEASLPAGRGPSVWGVDLGANAAMSAVSSYWPHTGLLRTVAAFPSIPDLEERAAKDNVGGLYRRMEERGELITTQGRTVVIAKLLRIAMHRFGPPDCVAGDRWRIAELTDALEDAGVPPGSLAERGQGFKDGGEDVRHFRRSVAEGLVATPVSLLMRSAIGGAVVVSDAVGNSKLAKSGDTSERRSRHRDDAIASAILAVAEGRREAMRLGIVPGGAEDPEDEAEMPWVRPAAEVPASHDDDDDDSGVIPVDI